MTCLESLINSANYSQLKKRYSSIILAVIYQKRWIDFISTELSMPFFAESTKNEIN